MNNQDSLRTQIIDAMVFSMQRPAAEKLFDVCIMPVLDKAMKAGELLVHRATLPQKPVSLAIMDWLEACCSVVNFMRQNEATVSRRQLLNIIYQFEEGATKALLEARALVDHGD